MKKIIIFFARYLAGGVVLGVVVVLISTILCVYAAGRIFRIGILMQGKGARIGEMLKWVVRG